jgi:hypothetical protein
MSRRPRRPLEPSEVPYAIFRSAAVPTLSAAAVCLVVASFGSGRQGFLGSLLGTAIVVAFYWTDLATLRIAERVAPKATFGLFIGEYLIKISLLAGLFASLQNVTALDVRMMGLTIGVTAIVWTVSLAISAARARTFVVEGSAGPQSSPGP